MSHSLLYVLNALGPVIVFFFVARFLLQASRADFYNQISQGIVAITDPITKPLRLLIPSMGNIDLASLIGAWIIKGVLLYVTVVLADQAYPGTLALIVMALFDVLGMIVTVLKWFLIINIVASLIASFGGMHLQHPILSLISQIIEPVIAPARRLIPAMGGLDFSPILVFVLLGLFENSILPQLEFGILTAL